MAYDANNTYTVCNVENDTLTQGHESASILSTMQKTFIKPEPGGPESMIEKDSGGVVSLGTGTDLVQVNGSRTGGGIADTSGNYIVSRESATGVITPGSGTDIVLVTGGGTGGGIADTSENNVIKKKGDGSVHIGTNSFITRVFGGKQEIYAINSAGRAIDLNVKNGSDLLVNGTSVMGSIRGLATSVKAVTALSSAFSSVPTNHENSQYNCGFGLGAYGGKTAIAFGCAMRLSDNVSVNVAGSHLTSGSESYLLGDMPSVAFRAGLSFKFGRSTSKRTGKSFSAVNESAVYGRQLSETRREVSELRNQVVELETLKAEVAEMKLMMASFAGKMTTAMR